MSAALQAREKELAHLQAKLAWLEVELRTREARATALAAEVGERDAQLLRSAVELGKLKAELAFILTSRSWRVTAPLRIMPGPLRGRFVRRIIKVVYSLATFMLVKRLRRRRQSDGVTPGPEQVYRLIHDSGLFDVEFYCRANRDVERAGFDPLAHYLNLGAPQGLDPNPLFDTSFYLERNPDILRAGINPLEHYLTVGAWRGCDPNPFFDTSLYASDFEDSLQPRTTPLAHYLSNPAVVRGLRRMLRVGEIRLGWTENLRQYVQSAFCYTAERKYHDAPGAAGSRDRCVQAVIVVVDNAQPADPQLIALSLVKELVTSRDVDVFVLLKGDGPLKGQFLALAPTVALQTGSDREHLSQSELDELLTALRTRGADAAVCFGVMTGDIAERLKLQGVRVVTVVHELPSQVLVDGTPMLLQRAYFNSAHVVFPSQFLQDRLSCVFSPYNSAVVHGPGVMESNPFVEEREFARLQLTKQLDIPLSASIVLGCGNASRRHGFDLFVHLAELVTPRMVDREVHFVWIGEQPHDPGASYLSRTSNDDVVPRVHSPGDRIHPALCYAAADVFVLSCREDPFPTACLGAMEAGLPIVAFEGTGGIAEVIGNDAGILIPYLDVHAMSEALEDLLHDAQLRSSLGSHGKKRVKAHFQPRDYARFLLSLLYPAGDLVDTGVYIER